MSVKDAISNIVTAFKTKDIHFTYLVFLSTIVSSPSTMQFFPESIIKRINSKLDIYIKSRKIIINIKNSKFLIHDSASFRVIQPSFENSVWKIVESLDIKCFVDVGAHIGKYTIPLAKLGVNVLAIEPDPENFNILKYNVLLNNVSDKVKLMNCACYSKNGHLKLYIESGSDVRSIFGDGKYILVKAKKLDTLIKENKIRPDLIKIDVEGAEKDVLEGSYETLQSYHPELIIEVWNRNFKDVLKFLQFLGYKHKVIEEWKPCKILYFY